MCFDVELARKRLRQRGMSAEASATWIRLHTRDQFAFDHLTNRDEKPWQVREYQRVSMNSFNSRKVHCDGRDVGKTTEIELLALWASVACPNREMLIATQCENHLYPLMKRIVTRFESIPEFAHNIVEIRRGTAWHIRCANGFVLWGRMAGAHGVNFQGMHVDWQVVDEAQEMRETSWAELYQALNGGGKRWVYGVPNGKRDTFYRMATDPAVQQFNWPSTLNPDFDDAKDLELARLYGGKQSAGYIHRVLGQHGRPAYGVFDLDAYLSCVDESLDAGEIRLQEEDDFSVTEVVETGEYYLGCDLGYAQDPSEFVVYRAEGPRLVHVLRVHLEGVNYARQEEVLVELDRAYNFAGIGIDCGNSGRAVSHRLMERGEAWCEKVRAYEFGGMIDLAPLPDGRTPRRRVKEFMTELLQNRILEGTIVFPHSAERESQYASHTYSVGVHGRVIYEKGNDHIIDADRCVLLRWYEATQYDEMVPQGARIAGFNHRGYGPLI